MSESNRPAPPAPGAGSNDIIEIHDPDVNLDALLEQVRQTAARHRAEGAFREDLDLVPGALRLAQGAPVAGQGAEPGSVWAAQDAGGLLAELSTRWVLREMHFSSGIPVLGPIIVAIRNFWNWMSAKWYVGAIAQQQTDFNALVVRAIGELMAENRQLAAEVRQLQAAQEQWRAAGSNAGEGTQSGPDGKR